MDELPDDRRIFLINKKVEGELTEDESRQLRTLQDEFIERRRLLFEAAMEERDECP